MFFFLAPQLLYPDGHKGCGGNAMNNAQQEDDFLGPREAALRVLFYPPKNCTRGYVPEDIWTDAVYDQQQDALDQLFDQLRRLSDVAEREKVDELEKALYGCSSPMNDVIFDVLAALIIQKKTKNK